MSPEPRPRARIAVVDDEEQILRLLEEILLRAGHEVECYSRGAEALDQITRNRYDILLVDLKMPDMDGLEVMQQARRIDERLSVFIMTGYASLETAIRAMKMGAEDYLLKPLNPEALNAAIGRTIARRRLQGEHELLRQQVAALGRTEGIIARSKPMIEMVNLVAKVAPLPSTVLLQGESGTGKELLARALHAMSPRSQRSFVAINCAVIPLNLQESELFGHERGAFTGAESRRPGYFEAAEGGSIFLDEISETSLDLQVKLLRVLQERRFRRVGGTKELAVDVRIIASTNRDLEEEVRRGRFRADLFFRINVIPLRVPPLRDRPEDIPFLALHFLGKYAQEFKKDVVGIRSDAMTRLLHYSWPGNVRELENTIQRALAIAEGKEIRAEELFEVEPTTAEPTPGGMRTPILPYAQAREEFERTYLRSLMKAARGSVVEAARLARIARQNVHAKMKKLGLERASLPPDKS